MITTTTALAAMLLAGAPDDATVTISAAYVEPELTVGESHQIELTVELADGWSCTSSGMRSAMLQIDVPEGITLQGEVLTGHRELARNEFVQAPFEREIQAGMTTIEFTLDEAAAAGATIGLNVVAYLNQEGSDDHHFMRRRLELPLKAGATATEVDASNTTWGVHDTLSVGDQADAFTLPQFPDTEVSLEDYLDKKNIIVTTYRAFW